MAWQVMPDYQTYERARDEFAWALPDAYNPVIDCLRKHDSPEERLALRDAATGDRYTYTDVDRAAGRLANAFAARGIEPGDRVAVVAPQRPGTLVAHMACWSVGAITVPLTTLFGRDALAYRLDDAGARAVVFDPIVRDALAAASRECPTLEIAVDLGAHSWYVGDSEQSGGDRSLDCPVADYEAFVDDRDATHEPYASTPATDSAIMYTSGSTGPPKGVLHSHALWLGRAAAAYNFFDGHLDAETVSWTPADWAWGSALGGLLYGTLHHGGTVVAAPMQGFDPAAAFTLCEQYVVTDALAPPTALRMLMSDDPSAYELALRVVATAGEPLTPEILEWADAAFTDLTINEYYGQTELNLVVANASRWFETKPGSMGKPLPGYEVTILDPDTREPLPPGDVGEIAVLPGDERVFFTEYWIQPEATAAKQHGDWYLTGDLASRDTEGYLHFESRADDVIITSGYRVGPLEVERVLLEHPSVTQAGAIGVPDETRGEIIKAFVELAPDAMGDETLRQDLREMTRERLAAYEYPREIEFVDDLPKTASGKVRRVALRERDRDPTDG